MKTSGLLNWQMAMKTLILNSKMTSLTWQMTTLLLSSQAILMVFGALCQKSAQRPNAYTYIFFFLLQITILQGGHKYPVKYSHSRNQDNVNDGGVTAS